MIKHIVMWKLKDPAGEADKTVNMRKIKNLLESLRDKIKEIKHIEVGINMAETDASADVVLYSEFECMEDLVAYQKHPEHLKVVQYIKGLVTERRVVDYQVL